MKNVLKSQRMDEMSEEIEDNILILFPSGPRTFLVRD